MSLFPTNPVLAQGASDLMGHRRTWDGHVIHDLTGQYGGYWRVTESWRDPATGEWYIQADEYIGDRRPTGEPVYKWTGKTWDMPAYSATIFPGGLALGLWIGLIVITAVIGATQVESAANTARWGGGGSWADGLVNVALLLVGLHFIWAVVVLWAWFYRTETVRGTKVGAVIMAISVAAKASAEASQQEFTRRYDPPGTEEP